MNCEVIGNRILIHQAELDIYDAQVLKEKISSVAAENHHSVVLDLNKVEEISTPIAQILLAAKESIGDFRVSNLSEGVSRSLRMFGFLYEDI